jgi:hypothetical protein
MPSNNEQRLRRGAIAAAVVAVAAAIPAAQASSHREAPLIAADPAVDNTATEADQGRRRLYVRMGAEKNNLR